MKFITPSDGWTDALDVTITLARGGTWAADVDDDAVTDEEG